MFRTCVSLLPAATQMILDMGFADSLRGVTHFCPPQAQKRCPVLLRIQDGQAHLQVSLLVVHHSEEVLVDLFRPLMVDLRPLEVDFQHQALHHHLEEVLLQWGLWE